MRYWVRINKQSVGPLTPEEIAKHPEITEATLVCAEDKTKSTDWVRLRTVPEFRALLSPAPHNSASKPTPQPPPLPSVPKPPPLPSSLVSATRPPDADAAVPQAKPMAPSPLTPPMVGPGVAAFGLLFIFGFVVWSLWVRPMQVEKERREAEIRIARETAERESAARSAYNERAVINAVNARYSLVQAGNFRAAWHFIGARMRAEYAAKGLGMADYVGWSELAWRKGLESTGQEILAVRVTGNRAYVKVRQHQRNPHYGPQVFHACEQWELEDGQLKIESDTCE